MVVLLNSVIHVAVGVIFNTRGEVLIAERPPEKSYSGLWEFPGGKVEADETVFQALQRELLEEIGIQVIAADAWLKVEYDYPGRRILLDTWRVTQFLREPIGREGQTIQWVSPDHLNQFQFLAGSARLVEQMNFR